MHEKLADANCEGLKHNIKGHELYTPAMIRMPSSILAQVADITN